MRMLRWLAAAIVAVGLGGLPACSAPVSGPAVVLTLASPDPADAVNAVHVQHFADEVARRSGGSIGIDPVWDVAAEGVLDWDQVVARSVADGTYDLGLVPSRAWDVLGVTSLRALNTPFLITGTELLEDVLTSEGLRSELMSGLPHAGVVGLDLFPAEWRHPFGYDEPLLGVHDYQNEVLRAPRSETVEALLRALGASDVVDSPQDPRTQRGMETSYEYAGSGVMTGNVVFFPKVESLVVDADVRDRLRDDQWAILQEAATATRDWLFDELPSEAEAAAEFCAKGGEIVSATQHDLSDIERATVPVVEALREDARTGRLIDAISALAGNAGATASDVVGRCPEPDDTTSEPDGLHELDGIYTAHVTKHVLREHGVTDPYVVRQNSGRFTWTLDGGTWSYQQQSKHYVDDPIGSGSYTYDDGQFRMHWDATNYTDARLRIAGDGSITFHDIHDSDPTAQKLSEGFYSIPWKRVGNLPD